MKVGTDGTLLGSWARGGRKILDIGTGTGLVFALYPTRYRNSDGARQCREASRCAAPVRYRAVFRRWCAGSIPRSAASPDFSAASPPAGHPSDE